MTVSVIIPVYNEEKMIRQCLTSLSTQTKECEVIVVDDGSTDKTLSALSELQTLKFPAKPDLASQDKFQIIEQKHLGPGAARNFGAKKSNGEILVFVDSDMTFAPNFIEELIRPIEEGKSKGTFTKEEYVINWDNVWARCWNYNLNLTDKLRIPKDYPDTAPVFRAILKNEFEKVGGFTQGVGWTDDWTLSEKLNYKSTVTSAVCFHSNPNTLSEIFHHAKWIGKNKFIGGSVVRRISNTFRFSLPISIFMGMIKMFRYKEPLMFPFRIIYDFGISLGLAESWFTNDRNK